VTEVIVSEGLGVWREYVGGYSDWERVKNEAAKAPAAVPMPAVKSSSPKANEMSSSAQNTLGKKVKLSYKEQRELEELPQLIASLEDEQSAITAQLNAPDFYKTNPADARRINARFAEIEELLLDVLERWERLEARARGE
jgi:ATP-binding cassette subfamily F protein uup